MFAHDLKVTEIAKRDMVFAWCKKSCKINDLSFEEGDTIKASGHWMTKNGPYVQLEEVNNDFVDERYDVVLNFEDWTINTLVKVEKQ